jgi:hypothetical protein
MEITKNERKEGRLREALKLSLSLQKVQFTQPWILST